MPVLPAACVLGEEWVYMCVCVCLCVFVNRGKGQRGKGHPFVGELN